MNYIIEPRWFYWVGVLETLDKILLVLFVILSALLLINLFSGYDSWLDDKDELTRYKKTNVFLIILITIILLITVFLPTKETLIQMKVAEFATYDNVNISFEKLIELIDYIVEKLR